MHFLRRLPARTRASSCAVPASPGCLQGYAGERSQEIHVLMHKAAGDKRLPRTPIGALSREEQQGQCHVHALTWPAFSLAETTSVSTAAAW